MGGNSWFGAAPIVVSIFTKVSVQIKQSSYSALISEFKGFS